MGMEPTILLVEDNPDDAELTLLALRKSGVAARVIELHDGVEAVDYLLGRNENDGDDDNLPKLILMDLKLPLLDGLEVLRRLRADARTQTIPIVILSTSKQARDMVEAYRLGANSYVLKSVDIRRFNESMCVLMQYWLSVNETL